jgi:hypothetical protein
MLDCSLLYITSFINPHYPNAVQLSLDCVANPTAYPSTTKCSHAAQIRQGIDFNLAVLCYFTSSMRCCAAWCGVGCQTQQDQYHIYYTVLLRVAIVWWYMLHCLYTVLWWCGTLLTIVVGCYNPMTLVPYY